MNKTLKKVLLTLGATLTLVGCGVEESVESVPTIDTEEVVIEDPVSEVEVSAEAERVSETLDTEIVPDGYTLIEVDGGDTSGYRQPNVVVNVGHGDREYWAYTNEHGQLVRVWAKEIIVQDDSVEDVNSDGRYYSRMADVPGVGADTGYDRGHVIADSLGGVANAYNITPQEATLNRHGDQAYMERVIRDAGGVSDLEAIITYPDTTTQIPSHYEFTYTIKGNRVTDSFANTNPDKVNEELGLTTPEDDNLEEEQDLGNVSSGDVSGEYVDANGNGLIKGSSSGIYHVPDSRYYDRTTNPVEMFKTIQEAEQAGYRAPK